MPKDISVIRKIIAEIRNPSVNIYENRALNSNKAADTSGKTPKNTIFLKKSENLRKFFPISIIERLMMPEKIKKALPDIDALRKELEKKITSGNQQEGISDDE